MNHTFTRPAVRPPLQWGTVERYEFAEAAQRAGISPDQLRQLVELGVIAPDAEDRFTPGDVRRARAVREPRGGGHPGDGGRSHPARPVDRLIWTTHPWERIG